MKVIFLVEVELTDNVEGAAELMYTTLLDIQGTESKYNLDIKDVYVEGVTSVTGRH